MKCYECAKMGKDTDAVGICIICGRGVCKEHLKREETPVWDEDAYTVKIKGEDIEHLKRILCIPCHEALMENVCEVVT